MKYSIIAFLGMMFFQTPGNAVEEGDRFNPFGTPDPRETNVLPGNRGEAVGSLNEPGESRGD